MTQLAPLITSFLREHMPHQRGYSPRSCETYLDAYMRGRDESGNEGGEAREILRAHFHGERALFSPESSTNRRDFQSEMTFPDPEGGADIFAHFHGKISHRFFRLHFDWPVPSTATRLKVLYIGPKLTKS